jgi:hypothetical protein
MQATRITPLAIFAGFTSLFCPPATLALAEAPSPNIASTNDCAVIAAAAKSGYLPAPAPAVRIMSGSFGANCDWSKLGVPITTTDFKSSWIRDFSRPRYASNGLEARFEYADDDYVWPRFGPDPVLLHIQVYRCMLQKTRASDKEWKFVNCIVLQV